MVPSERMKQATAYGDAPPLDSFNHGWVDVDCGQLDKHDVTSKRGVHLRLWTGSDANRSIQE